MTTIADILNSFGSISSPSAEFVIRPDNNSGVDLMAFTPTMLLHSKAPQGFSSGKTYSIQLESVLATCKRDPNSKFQIQNDSLLVSTKNSNIEILLKEIQYEGSIGKPSSALKLTLKKDLHELLSSILPRLALEKLFPSQPDFLLTVHADSKSLWIVTHEDFQSSFIRLKNTYDFEGSFTTPYSSFVSLVKKLPVNSMLYIEPDVIRFALPDIKGILSTPTPQVDNIAELVLSRIKSVKFNMESAFTIPSSALTDFLSSIRGISSDDSRIQFTLKKTVLSIDVKSSRGTANFLVKASNPNSVSTTFGLEFKAVRGLISRFGSDNSELTLTTDESGILYAQSASVIYMTVTSSNS